MNRVLNSRLEKLEAVDRSADFREIRLVPWQVGDPEPGLDPDFDGLVIFLKGVTHEEVQMERARCAGR